MSEKEKKSKTSSQLEFEMYRELAENGALLLSGIGGPLGEFEYQVFLPKIWCDKCEKMTYHIITKKGDYPPMANCVNCGSIEIPVCTHLRYEELMKFKGANDV